MPRDLLVDMQPRDLLAGENSPETKTLIPQMTDAMKVDHPVLAGIDQTANDVSTIGYKAANGLSLGILGNILKSKGIQEPNFDSTAPDNKSGLNLLGDAANFGGAGKTLGAIGGKIGDIANATGATKLISSVLNKSGDAWNSVKQAIEMNRRLPAAKTLQDSVEKLVLQKDNLTSASQILSNTNSLKVRDIQSTISKINSSLSDGVKDIANQIGKQSEELSTTLKSEIGKKVSSTQDAVPTFFRNAGNAYGQTLDHIIESVDAPVVANGLIKKGAAPATKQEIFDKLSGILEQGKGDPLIENSIPYKKIQLLSEKYHPESVSSGLVDATGKPLMSNVGGETVDLKQLLGEMRDMNASLKAGVRSGSKAISPEDLTVSRFNHAIGDLVKDRVPAFKDLQESYAPVMKAKELAYKVFKPSKGDFATNSAEAFFKRVAFKNKISGQDQALLDMLEKGTTVNGKEGGISISGIGDISSELKSIGNKISSLTEEKAAKQLAMRDGASLNVNGLQSQIKFLKDNQNKFNLDKINRINTLDSRLSVIQKALQGRNQINQVKKTVSLNAAKGLGLAAVGKLGINAIFNKKSE